MGKWKGLLRLCETCDELRKNSSLGHKLTASTNCDHKTSVYVPTRLGGHQFSLPDAGLQGYNPEVDSLACVHLILISPRNLQRAIVC